jgi:hypothetical protein
MGPAYPPTWAQGKRRLDRFSRYSGPMPNLGAPELVLILLMLAVPVVLVALLIRYLRRAPSPDQDRLRGLEQRVAELERDQRR